jgi:iron complex outermembrane recepter protein
VRRAAAAAPLAALLLLPGIARPQRADTARADSTRADSTKVHKLAPTVVTGTRLSDVDEQLPAQIDKVDVRTISPGAAQTATALSRLPGVSVFDDQGSPAQPTVEVRGFSLSPVVGVPQGVSVFLDGVRVNEPDAQEVNFDLLPSDAIARSELVRGPATLYGKNTLAGALVLFTQRGEAVPVLEGEVSGGSYGALGVTVNAGGMAGGFDGFLSANLFNESAWRQQGGLTERSVFINLGHKSDSSDLAFTVMYAHDSIAEPGSLPASWLAVNPRLNYTGGDFFAPDLWHLALRGERQLGVGRLRGAIFFRHNASEQFNVNVNAASSDAFITNESYGATAEWSAPLSAFSRPLALTVGAEIARNDVMETIYARLTSDTAVTIPPTCTAATGLCADVHVPEDDAGLFAQAVLTISPALTVTAAARGDWVRVPFEDLYDSANSATSSFSHLSPRIGANLTMSPTVRGYASVSGGFRAPAPVELGCASPDAPCPLPYALGSDPPLKPVTLVSYEAGADWEPRRGSTLEGSLFWSEVHDEIVFVASTNTQGYFQNIPDTRRQGIELSGTLALPRGFRASASYTYLDATYQSTVLLSSQLPVPDSVRPGNVFPLSPHDRVTLTVGNVQVVGAGTIDAELGMNAVSTQFLRGDDANAEAPLPGYAVWRLRVAYQREHFGITASVRNLFNHKFSSFGTYADNPVGPPGGPPSDAIERFYTPAQPISFIVAVKLSR